jgi:hypothetical protein
MSSGNKLGGAKVAGSNRDYLGDCIDIRHLDGKQTLTLYVKENVNLLGVKTMLQEVPDAAGTTLTVQVTDGDDNAITDTETFTEGVDAKGAIYDHVMDATYWALDKDTQIKIVIGGTTTTLGEAIVKLLCQRR